jgi:hypothetical protein
VPNPANPQNFNRFGYVLNNPVNLVDPSGHCVWDLCLVETSVAATVGILIVVAVVATIMTIAIYTGADSIANSIDERWKLRNTNQKNMESISKSLGKTEYQGLNQATTRNLKTRNVILLVSL